MESMRGPRWRALVRTENERFDTAVGAAVGPKAEHLRAAALSFEAARLEAEVAGAWTWDVAGLRLQLRPQPGGSILWNAENIGGSGKAAAAPTTLSGDLDVEEGILVHTVDAGHGAEKYRLIALRSDGKVAWSSGGGRGFGPPVAALAGRVYCLEATGPLQYQRLVSFDLRTGADRRIEYEETNPSVMLELVRGTAGCLFLVTDLAGRQRLYHVGGTDGAVKRLTYSGETAVHPVGYYGGASKEPCYLVRSRGRGGHWIARGSAAFKSFWATTLPAELLRSEEFGIDAVLFNGKGMIVVREHGQRTAWVGRRRVAEWFGEFEANPWLVWKGAESASAGATPFIVHRPGSLPSRDWVKPISYAPNTASGFAKNATDGAQVRWFVCWAGGPAARPKGLIATVYGAYGMPTRLMTSRWKPYLERGVAIGFTFVRGGGDHTEAWAAAGQVAGKALGIADFESAVEAMQKATGLDAGATVAFGRSAGGYIVGNSVVARPGRYFGAAYMEVPYVDVLRTSTNPVLPLTQYEYEEFGNPAAGPAEFETVMRLSPVDVATTAPAGAYDDVFVLCRTFESDKSVFAYESLKLVDALRSGESGVVCEANGAPRSAPKLVAVSKGHGHFSFGVAASLQRAEDFVLIMENLEKH